MTQRDDLIVLRTFSKPYGMAGLRLAWQPHIPTACANWPALGDNPCLCRHWPPHWPACTIPS
ncbi:hypothetical protein ACE0DR_26085 [Azotobacter sp. CWF10]